MRIVVVPVKVLLPVSVRVPEPFWARLPVPLITPLKVTLLLRLNTREALSVMLPASEPVAPPLPIRNVPPAIVVVPVKLFVPVSISVPPPFFARVPVPLMTPEYVQSPLLIVKAAPLLAMLPVRNPLPGVPSPICSVPALMVVAPVKRLLPVRTSVPEPSFTRPKVPEMPDEYRNWQEGTSIPNLPLPAVKVVWFDKKVAILKLASLS